MRTGLLTFHDTTNFGSLLQTYGLYKKIVDLGMDCEVIDYQCESIVAREMIKPIRFSLSPRAIAKELLFGRHHRNKYKCLHNFLVSNMTLSKTCSRENIKALCDSYDKFIVGSDIVWGLDITNNDTTYFLDFVTASNKKTAFSSSIGSPWNDDEKRLVAPLLKDFSYIAVREEEAADWVGELTNSRPEVVCDPTMLLNANEWRSIIKENRKYKRGYVLVYFDNGKGECVYSAIKYAQKHNLDVRFINYGIKKKGTKSETPYSLSEFLSLIDNAEMIITASYHGMLFSLYFNRPFVYYNRAHKSRMNTLAMKMGVEYRNGSEFDVLNMLPIDYSKVNTNLECYRNSSISSLKYLLEK